MSNRQRAIVEFARENGKVEVDDLARRLEVSPQTIRKDLNELCDARIMLRVHGGAIVSSGVENLSYEARRFVAADAKRAIGRLAATLVPDKSSLFINIGTTTEEVAAALTGHKDLLVITNNLNVAMQLYPMPSINVVLAGGPVRRTDGAIVGETAVDLIRQFKVDVAIIGASAIDADGSLLDFDHREVRVAQAIIENARRVILVADSTKFERSAPVRIGHIEQIDDFVTDSLTDPAIQQLFAKESIAVHETDAMSDFVKSP